jgi:hypothetical protein
MQERRTGAVLNQRLGWEEPYRWRYITGTRAMPDVPNRSEGTIFNGLLLSVNSLYYDRKGGLFQGQIA